MEFLFWQGYSVYRNREIGRARDGKGNLKIFRMGDSGCAICSASALISYHNSRREKKPQPLYPNQFLDWLLQFHYLTTGGGLMWEALTRATDGTLRFSFNPASRPGETSYTIRQVIFADGHFVVDDPLVPNMILDSFDGKRKPFKSYSYTGYNLYFFGL